MFRKLAAVLTVFLALAFAAPGARAQFGLLGVCCAPSGGGGGTPTTFDPTVGLPYNTYTGGNLTATANQDTPGFFAGALSVLTISADGDYGYDAAIPAGSTSPGSFTEAIGIANGSKGVSSVPDSGANGLVEWADGSVGGSASGTGPGFGPNTTASHVINVRVHLAGATRTAQFGLDGGTLSAPFVVPAGALFIYVSFAGTGHTATLSNVAW